MLYHKIRYCRPADQYVDVLTVTEVAEYYHIGENKLRMIADEHPEADFIIMNGNRILIKRQKFEEYLDRATVV